jgi:hypothetical protein
MASDDPDFETKTADIIGLYLNPPERAAVFCVDEKTAIQARDRLAPVLPLLRAAPSGTASNTTGMARFPSMLRWKRGPGSRKDRGSPHEPGFR